MIADREQRVRQRAHEIWQTEGCPEGRSEEHWARADQEITAEDAVEAAPAIAETAPAAVEVAPAIAEVAAAKPKAKPKTTKPAAAKKPAKAKTTV